MNQWFETYRQAADFAEQQLEAEGYDSYCIFPVGAEDEPSYGVSFHRHGPITADMLP